MRLLRLPPDVTPAQLAERYSPAATFPSDAMMGAAFRELRKANTWLQSELVPWNPGQLMVVPDTWGPIPDEFAAPEDWTPGATLPASKATP